MNIIIYILRRYYFCARQRKNAFCRPENGYQDESISYESGGTCHGEPVVWQLCNAGSVGFCVAERRACHLFGILCHRDGNVLTIYYDID